VAAEITTDRIFFKLRPILVSYGREQPANFPRKTTTREPGDAQREAKEAGERRKCFSIFQSSISGAPCRRNLDQTPALDWPTTGQIIPRFALQPYTMLPRQTTLDVTEIGN
jgi:hypothetical protein